MRESADEECSSGIKSKRISFLSFDEVIRVMKFESIEKFVGLFEKGLIENINATNDTGETYLMIACEGGFIDCARVLIERGAGVNLS